jgi:hypothetical protein
VRQKVKLYFLTLPNEKREMRRSAGDGSGFFDAFHQKPTPTRAGASKFVLIRNSDHTPTVAVDVFKLLKVLGFSFLAIH